VPEECVSGPTPAEEPIPTEEITPAEEPIPTEEVTPAEETTPAAELTLVEEKILCPKCRTHMERTATGYACPNCGYYKSV